MEQFLITILLVVPALLAVFLILKYPYLGLVIVVASLPVVGILPDVPFATSIFPVVGGLTIGAYVLSLLRVPKRDRRSGSRKIMILSIVFVFWMFISNPYAAIQPDADGRVWLFTFFQLLILVWLASHLMDKPYKHFVLFTVYSLATGVSAFYAVYNGGVAETVTESIRSGGLAGGANTAARYFLVALVFLYYLQVNQKSKLVRTMLFACMGLIALGVVFTVSRTGVLLFVSAIGLLIALEGERNRSMVLIFVLVSVTAVWFLADNILAVSRTILPSIQSGSDTVGLRYMLWQAGIRMLEDEPLKGVGIGQFPENLPFYAGDLLHKEKFFRLGAHNMYIQIAAETGLVGLMLFVSILVLSLASFWRSRKTDLIDISTLAKAWLVAFVLILLGGITKHDHADKLLWFMVGISSCQLWTKSVFEKENKNFRVAGQPSTLRGLE